MTHRLAHLVPGMTASLFGSAQLPLISIQEGDHATFEVPRGTYLQVSDRTVDVVLAEVNNAGITPATDPFRGLRIGDVVRRGAGTVRWRITGLAMLNTSLPSKAPAIHLQSISDNRSPSSQSATAYGNDIQRLTRIEDQS